MPMTKSRREELPINITNELYNSDAKPTSQYNTWSSKQHRCWCE